MVFIIFIHTHLTAIYRVKAKKQETKDKKNTKEVEKEKNEKKLRCRI